MTKKKIIKIFFITICFLQIFYIFHFRSGFEYDVIKNPFSKDSGIKYALPPEAIETKNLIIKRKLKSFNLSKNLINQGYIYQRIIEFNYPIRIDESSKFIFLPKEEKISSSCKTIEIEDYLKLIHC